MSCKHVYKSVMSGNGCGDYCVHCGQQKPEEDEVVRLRREVNLLRGHLGDANTKLERCKDRILALGGEYDSLHLK